MEYVKGVPLTKYCDDARLTVQERLALFVPVCQAVQHAHQKGIIHRDLKPSNILICLYDGKPAPKVIDFGLAKAMHQPLTEHTLYTAHGVMMGTPLYMSPEQAEFNNLDIDTRTDIYSLGVVLYELLTGSTPLERQRFKEGAWQEMLRLIKEEEPPKPSTRLSELSRPHAPREASVTRSVTPTMSLASVSAQRHTEPAKLSRLVRGELDWIVMKCLEKERSRRYETANGLAMDLQRYLADEPVLAGPPSVGYRFRKFLRRNKGPVIAASLVLLALVAGIVGTSIGLIRAEQRRVEAERARADESEQRQIAEAEKEKAQKAAANTLADYRASTDDAIEQLIGSKEELGPQERAYLEKTLKRWQAFANRQGDDERSRAIRAEGHFRVALLWDKLGRKQEARAEYLAARHIQKKLVEQFPAVLEYRQDLARTHIDLGNVLAGLGTRAEAQAENQAGRDLQKKLVEQFPGVSAYQQDLARTHNNLGVLLADLGKREEARWEHQVAREIQKKLVEQFPAVPEYQQDLARTHNNQGLLVEDLGKQEEARADFLAARDIQKKLVERFPAVPAYQQDLATTHNNLGLLLEDLGKREEARAEFQAARDLWKKLVEHFPARPDYQRDLAVYYNNLGNLLKDLGKREEARAEFQAARELQKKLVEHFPGVPRYQIELGASYCNYGNLIRDEGKPAESLEWLDLAIRTLQPVRDKEPRDVTAKQFLRNGHVGRARAYDRLQNQAEATKDWDRAIELSSPDERAGVRVSRATSRIQAGLVAEAVAEVAELTPPAADTTGLANWNAGHWYNFACVYALASGKIADKKQEYADRAMELLHQAVKAGWKDAAHMAKDTDLDPLREREDFKKLLAELDKQPPPKK